MNNKNKSQQADELVQQMVNELIDMQLNHPEEWKEYQKEVKLWDNTLADGLDDE